MDDIIKYRHNIDEIDKQLVELISQRINLSKKIISSKLESGNDVNSPEREDNIFQKFSNDKFNYKLNSIFKEILKVSKYEFLPDTSLQDILKFRPIIIAGPCAVENESQISTISSELNEIGIRLLRGGSYKPRTSPDDFQGLGSDGVKLLSKYAKKNKMYSVTELLDEDQLRKHYNDVDIIQIGSRNMTNYAFLKEVGKMTSNDGKPVILKRGFSATLNEFINAAKYISIQGNPNIILALRGIRTFEQIDSEMRNTPDLAAILELKNKTDFPVIFDPSHSTGDRKYVIEISKAAIEIGADGIIIETHNEPDKALVDGKQSITPNELKKIFNFL